VHRNLIVAIGSSEHRDERTNPFSGAERKRMLESHLRELQIPDVKVVALRDGPGDGWDCGGEVRRARGDTNSSLIESVGRLRTNDREFTAGRCPSKQRHRPTDPKD
jgi:hypothetical protein